MGGGWVFVLDDIVYNCLWYSLLTTEYVYLFGALWLLSARTTGDKFVGVFHF